MPFPGHRNRAGHCLPTPDSRSMGDPKPEPGSLPEPDPLPKPGPQSTFDPLPTFGPQSTFDPRPFRDDCHFPYNSRWSQSMLPKKVQ